MREFDYTVTDVLGIHARPAGLLSKEAKKFSSTIMIYANGKSAKATALMKIMALGVKNGDTVHVTTEGYDEEPACIALKKFFEMNL
ncbi:MAG: HPr family phosphocarrier protein [Ruminococcus sp.]|nr:HPr family phosphocarrier protein [Ruminococcus sp.]